MNKWITKNVVKFRCFRGFWDFGKREGTVHRPVQSFLNCLILLLILLISCFPHPWARILPSLLPTLPYDVSRFGELSARRLASRLPMKMNPNLLFWTIPQLYAKSINPGCLAGFNLRVFGLGVDCLEWGWWGLNW